jgi:Lysine methyltransferase
MSSVEDKSDGLQSIGAETVAHSQQGDNKDASLIGSSKNYNHHSADFDDDYDEIDETDDDFSEYISSIRSSTGLETGLSVAWPGLVKPLVLSTCLPETEIAPMFHGTQWAGTRVWRAALVALDYLLSGSSPLVELERQRASVVQQGESLMGDTSADDNTDQARSEAKNDGSNNNNNNSHYDTAQTINSSISILELGCGLGVPGMVLNALKGYTVVLTDRASLLDSLEANLRQNECKSTISAYPLDWTAEDTRRLLQDHRFDLVLNCDCIYEPLYGKSHEALWDCQEECLRANSKTVMLTVVERRTADGVDIYLERVRQSSLVTTVELVANPPGSPTEVEIYRIHGKQ